MDVDRAAGTDKRRMGVFMLKEKRLDKWICWYVPLLALLFCFEGLLGSRASQLYAVCVLPSLCFLFLLLRRNRLLRREDCLLLAAFFLVTWLSSVYGYGLGTAFFLSQFFCRCCILFFLYAASLSLPDWDRMADRWIVLAAAGLLVLHLLLLVRASISLCSEYPGHDLILGCFQYGRLCGLGNPNIMGFSAAALLFLSVYGLLRFSRGRRWFFALPALLGWFNLGLCNCRTGIVGVSLALGLLVFLSLHKGTGKSLFLGILLALLTAVGAAGLLFLPTLLYRLLMMRLAELLGNPFLAENLSVLHFRTLIERDGTFMDRTRIWLRCLEEVFRTPRRALLGVSSSGWGVIPSVYPGHHEILTPHSHNGLLEILHRFGLFGLFFWLWLTVLWLVRGVRLFFDRTRPLALRYLCAAAAGMLVMGLAEPLPYHPTGLITLAFPYFLICGAVMRERRLET